MDWKKNFQILRSVSLITGSTSFVFIFIILIRHLEDFILINILYPAIIIQMAIPGLKLVFIRYKSEQVKKYDLLSQTIIFFPLLVWIIIFINNLLPTYIFSLMIIIVAFQIMVFNIIKLKKTKLKQSITNSFRTWLIFEGIAALFLVFLIIIEFIFNGTNIPLLLIIYLGMEGVSNIFYGFKGAIFYDSKEEVNEGLSK